MYVPEMGNKTPLEILREARGLVSDPARWVDNEILGVDARGQAVLSYPDEMAKAVKFSSRGAMNYASWLGANRSLKAFPMAGLMAGKRLLEAKGKGWGDRDRPHSHAEVLACFDAAIAAEVASSQPTTEPTSTHSARQ